MVVMFEQTVDDGKLSAIVIQFLICFLYGKLRKIYKIMTKQNSKVCLDPKDIRKNKKPEIVLIQTGYWEARESLLMVQLLLVCSAILLGMDYGGVKNEFT